MKIYALLVKFLTLSLLSILFIGCQKEEFFEKDAYVTYEDKYYENYPPPAPKVQTAGVVTMLIALGDLANQQLVVSQDAAIAIAQNVISYTSPVTNPKILVIQDFNHNGESLEDTEYIRSTLLQNYTATLFKEIENEAIDPQLLQGYDIVWFNNPGHKMGSEDTKNLLKNFQGGVVLSGDDLSMGRGFSTEDLTGLINISNGTNVTCSDQQTYQIDNNSGYQYKVALEGKFFEGVPVEDLKFVYGNDIDLAQLSQTSDKYEVLAYATGPVDACLDKRPVIVRYGK